jgi:hypothetical protein
MFELVKTILDALATALPALLKYKKDKRFNEIGTELFLLYSSLNRITVTGRSIVQRLETALQWLERKLAAGSNDRFSTDLDFLLRQQCANIIEFVKVVKRLGMELEVISPDVYVKLVPLLHGKINAIDQLLHDMQWRSAERDNQPRLVSYDANAIADLTMDLPPASRDASASLQARVMAAKRHTMTKRFEQEQPLLEADVLDVDVSLIHPAKFYVIADYLRTRRPAQILDELEATAADFREAILANFSTADILLSVGDRRAAIGEPWIGF